MNMTHDNTKTSRAVFPSRVGEYVFLERIHRQTKTPYLYGLYRGPNGERAFAKYCDSACYGEYRQWFKNEIAVYRALWSVLTNHPEILTAHPRVQIPKLLYADEHGDALILLIEYVDGDPLAVKSVDVQLSVYEDVMKFFGAITDAALPWQLKEVVQRRPRHLMGLFPVVALRALIRRPGAWRLTLRGIILFVRNIPSLIARFRPAFVHRDLTEWNIICRGDTFFVVDFQLSAIADSLVDTVALALRMSPDPLMVERFLALGTVTGSFNAQHSQGTFRTLGAYLAVLNISLPNGRPLNSIEAFLERIAADVHSDVRVGEVNTRYSCTVVHSLDEKLRADWQALWQRSAGNHLFNSPGFFEACRETFGIARYSIVLGFRDGALCAVLPLTEGRIFGVKSLFAAGSARNYADKLPLLIDEQSEELIQEIFSTLRGLGNVYLAEGSTSVAEAFEYLTIPGLVRFASRSPYVVLAPDTDTLRSMSRGDQRAMHRRLQQMGETVEFRMTGIESLDTVIAMERKSYRPKRRMAFFTDGSSERFFQMIEKYFPGSVQVGTVLLNGQPIAANVGFACGKTFYTYYMAFDERYRYLGPGKLALYSRLEWLKQHGFTVVDLLRGDSELKRQFASDARTQYDIYLSEHRLVLLWWRVMLAVWDVLKYGSSLQRKLVSSLPHRASHQLTPQT